MTAKATEKGGVKECYLCPGTCVTHVLTLKSLRFEPINRLEFAINRCDEILEVFIRYDVKSQRRRNEATRIRLSSSSPSFILS